MRPRAWSVCCLAPALLLMPGCLQPTGEANPSQDAGPVIDGGPMDAGYCVTTVPPACAGVLLTLSPAFCDGGIYEISATLDVPFQFQLTASCGVPPYQWTVVAGSGGLLPGLQLNQSGLITGVTTQPGIWPFTVAAMDTAGAIASGAYEVTTVP